MSDRIDNFTQIGCAGVSHWTRVDFWVMVWKLLCSLRSLEQFFIHWIQKFTKLGPTHHVYRFSHLYLAAACAGFLNVGWGDDTILVTQFCAGGLHSENNFTKSPGFISQRVHLAHGPGATPQLWWLKAAIPVPGTLLISCVFVQRLPNDFRFHFLQLDFMWFTLLTLSADAQ